MAKTTAEKQKGSFPLEGRGLGLIGISILCLLSCLSFHIEQPDKNWLGLVGWGIAMGLNWTFGLGSYLWICGLLWIGIHSLLKKEIPALTTRLIYFSLFYISLSLLLNLFAERQRTLAQIFQDHIYSESVFLDLPYPHLTTRYNLGGVPLYYLYKDLPTCNLCTLLSDVGVGLTATVTGFISFFLFSRLSFIACVSRCVGYTKRLLESPANKEKERVEPLSHSIQEIEETLTKRPTLQPLYQKIKSPKKELTIHDNSLKGMIEEKEPSPRLSKRDVALNAQRVVNGDFTTYQLPPLSLLKNSTKVDAPSLKKDVKRHAEILEETLLSFGIEAKVGEIHCGPTITSFEVHPAIGVKVQKIKTLENDIALNLQAKSIRIIAPIPGKAAVGIEIPSLYPQEVSFKELLQQYQQNPRKLLIPLLLGKTVSGDHVLSDLSRMPHCLIAGATGSGKSVCINTIILSILMNARPDEVKLVMIDPKKVELTPYTNLPHMIAPVITEPVGAYAALSWLVKEMQIRYDILKQLGLRNISAFNNRTMNRELEASLSLPIPVKMPMIVAIIDEFADLMMASSSDLETPIARIAQMARAVGIHLILATQRPSREVITGLIKANFPTRIAFKVASRINSQIILDDVGAESLLGNGDLLFLPPGSSALMRAQGAYISDEEIADVIAFICNQAPPNYLISSFDTMRPEEVLGRSSEESSGDQLYEEALQIVLDTKTASTTYLQRKLKIGYARAASLMDALEKQGVIAPQEGAKPRRILIDSPQNTRPLSKREEMDDASQDFTT